MKVSAEQLAATEVTAELSTPLLTSAVVLVVCIDLAVVAAFDQEFAPLERFDGESL